MRPCSWYERCPVNKGRHGDAVVTCPLEDAFIWEFQVSARFLHAVGLNSELWISYERNLFVNSRTNCYFSTEVNQIFYTPPCKRRRDFTEAYRIVYRAVLVRARAWFFCLVSFCFVRSGSAQDDTGPSIRTNEPPSFCTRYEVDSSEPNGITGTRTHAKSCRWSEFMFMDFLSLFLTTFV